MSEKQKKYIEDVIARCNFFRQAQIWPIDEVNFEDWLSNFKSSNDKYLASVILSFFCYYSKKMVNKLLNDSLGNVGYHFSKKRKYWKHNNFKSNTIYSFIPGETPNGSDSGFTFLRKLKREIGIPEEHLFDFDGLISYLKDNSSTPHHIVFVDDIIGSGFQCSKAMEILKKANCLKKDIDLITYAPLIANKSGINKIQKETPELFLSPAHILNDEYNLLKPSCMCWQGSKELYDAGKEMIFRTSEKVGIPNSDPAGELDIKGFKSQGLALAFEHGAPDAILGFFYFDENGWKPLIKRQYERITP
jgi:hypothetical protein